jgi:hypothetical protein
MQHLARLLTGLGLCVLLLPGHRGGSLPAAHAQGEDLLAATTGTVRLLRKGWKVLVPVSAGARLAPTDLLDVQGSATVLCAGPGPTVKVVSSGESTPCPQDRGWFVYNGAGFYISSRGAPQQIPYIVYPRKTLVLKTHPLLRWHATKARDYTVSIENEDQGTTVWQRGHVRATSMRYPDRVPTLQRGTTYLLVVKDSSGNSSEDDPARGLGFSVVSAANRHKVEQMRRAILALRGLDVTAQKLALAVRYATWSGEDGRGLWGEAWLLLDQVAHQRDTPAVQLWIGDMLRAMSLSNEAVTAYKRAWQQAKRSGELESQAAAEAGVWRVTRDPAALKAAIKLYEDLGDQADADALRKESHG